MRFPTQRRQSSLECFGFVPLALLLGFAFGCSSPRPTCWGTCEEDADCGSGLSCDPTIGYCVQEVGAPENIEACELDAEQVWVCAEHEVKIPLTSQSGDESVETQSVEVRGTPKGVNVVENQLEGSFEEGEHQVAWGNAPGRHLLTVNATTECPELDPTSQPQVCSGHSLDATLTATGGKGEVTWSLVGDANGITLDDDGRIEGVVTGSQTVTVAMVDERNVRVETELQIQAVAGCPSIETKSLPAGCVESVFEWNLDVSGPNIEFRAPSVISDDPNRDLEKLRLEITSPEDDVYRLRATPRRDAVGIYTVGLVADNENSLDQAELPFEVRSCGKENMVVCCDEEVTVNLGPGEWALTSPDNNPLRANVAILGENQLSFKRNGLGDGSYTLNLNNPSGDTESLLLLLSSPGQEGCSAGDGGGSDAGTSDPSTTSDGAVGPTPLPRLPDGCVGKSYSAIYDWGSMLQSAPTMSPDVGLDIQVSGASVIISGTPASAPAGTVTLTANGVSRELQMVVRTTCGFAYTAYAEAGGQKLYLGSLATGQPVVQVVDGFVPSDHEAGEFRIAPLGDRILVWSKPKSGSSGDQLFLLGPDGSTQATVPLSTEPVVIQDASWSKNGTMFSVIYDVEAADGGTPARYFMVVNPSDVDPWTIAKPLPDARDPIWPSNDYACVVAAGSIDPNTADYIEGTTCLSIASGDLNQPYGNEAVQNQSIQARSFNGGLLTINPDTEEFRYFKPPAGPVMHLAHFATPSGEYVARKLEGDNQTGIRIAPSTEDSFEETSAIRYVPNCDAVYTWSSSGKHLACLSGNDLVLVDLTQTEVVTATLDTENDYKTTLRSIFTANDRYYVFHTSPDVISYVDMSGPPNQWQVQTLELNEAAPADYVGLEPAGADNQLVAQGSAVHAIELPTANNPSPRVTELSGALAPSENAGCVRESKYVVFRNWCGGDDAHRRFLPSNDGHSVLYLSAAGHLVYSDTFDGSTRVELDGGFVLCDSQVTSCRAFAFGVQ